MTRQPPDVEVPDDESEPCDCPSWLSIIALAVAFFSLGMAIGTARAEPLPGRLFAIDGDTVWHYPARGAAPEKIRLLDIDAPETQRSACEAELVLGLRAKARLIELLRQRPVTIQRCAAEQPGGHEGQCRDRYGRTLARLLTPRGEAGAILMSENLALPYTSGGRAMRAGVWCGGQ